VLQRLRDERGSQIVEFALIAPILIYLLLMVPVLGMLVRAWVVAEIAAREAARTLAISGSPELACERAYQEVTLYGGLPEGDPANPFFHRSFITYNAVEGRVSVEYRQPTYMPGLGLLLGGDPMDEQIPVRGEATFMPEYLTGSSSPPASSDRTC